MVWWVKPIVVNILEWIFAVIATVFVVIRLYTRFKNVPPGQFRFKLSDWVLTITLLCFYAANMADSITIVLIHGVEKMNLSPNRKNPLSAYVLLSPHELRSLLKLLFASLFPYYGSWWGVKFYILILYYKIVEPMTLPKHRIALHAITILVVAAFIVWFGIYTLWCLPMSKNWDPYAMPGNYCVAYFGRLPFVITVGMHAGTEVLIFAFPFSFLYIIRRVSKQKFYAVTAMFAVGFVGVIISLSRVAYIVNANYTPIIGIINAWGALEQCVGIIVCCLPAFKTLLKRRQGNNTGFDSELVERTFSSNGAPDDRIKSVGSGDPSGSGNWSGTNRQSAALRIDGFERIESVRESAEAKSTDREMISTV